MLFVNPWRKHALWLHYSYYWLGGHQLSLHIISLVVFLVSVAIVREMTGSVGCLSKEADFLFSLAHFWIKKRVFKSISWWLCTLISSTEEMTFSHEISSSLEPLRRIYSNGKSKDKSHQRKLLLSIVSKKNTTNFPAKIQGMAPSFAIFPSFFLTYSC